MSKTAPLKKLPSEFLPSFPAYYDTGRKFYWIENDRNAWIEIRRPAYGVIFARLAFHRIAQMDKSCRRWTAR